MNSGEAKEVISAAEERFESIRRKTGLVLAPLLLVLFLITPFSDLSRPQHQLAAVVIFVITLWITEAIPIPAAALLGPALCAVFGIASAKSVFAPFADPVVFLFIGSFMLAQAMFAHGLDRRIAINILAQNWIGPRPIRILAAFGGVTAFLSMWLSNTATTAMMYPIGLSLLSVLAATQGEGGAAKMRTYGASMLLLCAYSASLGGIGTPVGSPPNLIGLGLIETATGIKVSFVQWMMLTAPIMILLFLVLLIIIGRSISKQIRSPEGFADWISQEKASLGPWSRAEKNTATAFLTAVTLWIAPGVLGILLGQNNPAAKFLTEHVPESVAALIGALLLFVLPVDLREHRFTLTWKQAVDIDWGTILLFGGGLSLGGLLFATGLAEVVGKGLQVWSGADSLWSITLLATGFGIFMTEFCSNTAAANVVVPISMSLALANGVDPILPAIGACLGASMAFVLPVSTPPNAIVYGSRLVPITSMIKRGIFMDVVALIVIPAFLMFWGPIALGQH